MAQGKDEAEPVVDFNVALGTKLEGPVVDVRCAMADGGWQIAGFFANDILPVI